PLFTCGKCETTVRPGLWSASGLCRLHLLDHLAELLQSDVLNLAHALAGDAELLPDLLERFLWTTIKTETRPQDRGFTRIECLNHLLQHPSDGLFFQLLLMRVGTLVLDDFGEIVRVFIPNGSIQGSR